MPFAANHSIVCNAPRARVYELIRRSSDWPRLFEPCLAVEVLEASDTQERIEITARINGESMTWQSHRRFLPEVCGIESTLTRPMKLVRAMQTSWRVVTLNAEQCLLVLEHVFELDDNIAGQVDGVATTDEAQRFIASAIDRNSRTELDNIRQAVEAVPVAEQVTLDRHNSLAVVCDGSADSVYAVIRNTSLWPLIFEACTGVQRLDGDERHELVRIEALQDDHRVAWNTHRTYYDDIRRIDYVLQVPMPFLAAMRGQWRVLPLGPDRCLLSVDRSWRMLEDVRGIREGIETVAQASALIDQFVDNNARSEMRAICAYVAGRPDASMACTHRHLLPFAPDDVYRVLAHARAWPDILPHCRVLEMVYDDAQYQEFLMRVKTPAGVETFRSVRLCNEANLTITFFQPEPPAVLAVHHGRWQVRSAPGGCEVVCEHQVELDLDRCAATFGDVEVGLHKRRIHEMLTGNAGATVNAVRAFLERAAAPSREAA